MRLKSEMSDQEQSSFSVQDNRSKSTAEDDVVTPEPQVSTTETDSQTDDFQFTGGNGEQREPRGLPDPGFLLNMAAVQMDASALSKALIPIFDQYAWSAMGFVADPVSGEIKVDLPSAQLSIDTVNLFLTRIQGSLSDTERRDLQRRLSDLRMNYLAKAKEQ